MNEILVIALLGVPLVAYLGLAMLPRGLPAVAGCVLGSVAVVLYWGDIYPEDDGKGFVPLARMQAMILAGTVGFAAVAQGARVFAGMQRRAYVRLVAGIGAVGAVPVVIALSVFWVR